MLLELAGFYGFNLYVEAPSAADRNIGMSALLR